MLNGDFVPARPLARKLLAAHPHDFDFLYLSGILENQGGQFAAARTHLEEPIALDPNHYNAHYNLGLVLAELKDFPAAKEQLEKAIALGATEPQVHFKLSTVLRALGDNERAQEQLKLYQQLNQAKINRTLAASKSAEAAKEQAAGNLQKAAALYREASDATPDDLALAFKLALALEAPATRQPSAPSWSAWSKSILRSLWLKISWAISIPKMATLPPPRNISGWRYRPLPAIPKPGSAWRPLSAWSLAFPMRRKPLPAPSSLNRPTTEALQLRKDLNCRARATLKKALNGTSRMKSR